MHCPIDQSVLVMAERQNIEIDYCPQCRGVWLSANEFERLVDRRPTAEHDAAAPDRHGGHDNAGGRPKKRRRSLSELFEFD